MPEGDPAFIDTAYLYALVNTRDAWHSAALRWQRRLAAHRRRLVTTEFVLAETADGLAAVRFRAQAEQMISVLTASPLVEVVPASSDLFKAALGLFRQRADKALGADGLHVVRRDGRARPVGRTDIRRALPSGRLPSAPP